MRHGNDSELLQHLQLFDDVPVLGHLAVAQAVHIDPGDGHLASRRGNAHEPSLVRPGIGPIGDDGVILPDQLVHREDRFERRRDGTDPRLQAFDTVGLAGKRAVLVVVVECDLVEKTQVASVENLVVVAPHQSLVGFRGHRRDTSSELLIRRAQSEGRPAKEPRRDAHRVAHRVLAEARASGIASTARCSTKAV